MRERSSPAADDILVRGYRVLGMLARAYQPIRPARPSGFPPHPELTLVTGGALDLLLTRTSPRRATWRRGRRWTPSAHEGRLWAWESLEQRLRGPMQQQQGDYFIFSAAAAGAFYQQPRCGQQVASWGRAGVVRAGAARLGHQLGQARHEEAGAGGRALAHCGHCTLLLYVIAICCSGDNSGTYVLYRTMYCMHEHREDL